MVTGASWVTVEAILERRVSDTTLRARRDEWIAAGVFDQLKEHALGAYDRIIGLDLSEVGLDGSIHKAPCGGEGTGKSPVDRRKLGWKWSIAVDRGGIPVGWAIDGANRSDLKLLEPTLADVNRHGLLVDIETRLSRHECGWFHGVCSQGRVSSMGPQESMTRARAAPAEWNPKARRTMRRTRWLSPSRRALERPRRMAARIPSR